MEPATSAALLAVLYGRVSTQDQARSGYSLPDQMRQCAEKAQSLGATQNAVFEDAIDGDFLARPGLDAARELIRHGGVKWFVCADPDRFSRTLMNQLLITDEIERFGVTLVFTQHSYEKTPEGQLFYQMRGAIAQFEKAKIKERTARGKREKLRQGKLAQGTAPYGYRFDTDSDQLLPHPEEAPAVMQAFVWAAEGMGAGAISERLNELRAPTRRGQKWFRGHINYMLRNTTYMGEMACNRWVITPKTQAKKAVKQQRPREEWTIVPVPPLIPVQLFQSVQALRKRIRFQRRGNLLLSGLAVCELCGGNMSYHPHPGGYHNLVCQHRYPDRSVRLTMPPLCKAPIQKALPFEEGVWRLVRSWLLNPEAHLAYLAQVTERPDTTRSARLQTEWATLEKALESARGEQAHAITFLGKGLLDATVATQILADTKSRIDSIQRHIAGIVAEVQTEQKTAAKLSTLASLRQRLSTSINDLAAELDGWSQDQKRTAIRLSVARVHIGPKRWFWVHPL